MITLKVRYILRAGGKRRQLTYDTALFDYDNICLACYANELLGRMSDFLSLDGDVLQQSIDTAKESIRIVSVYDVTHNRYLTLQGGIYGHCYVI